MWWVITARAGSIAGLGVPGAGGGFAGPAEPGAFGVALSPTAPMAATEPELIVDLGVLGTHSRTLLDTWAEPIDKRGASPIPSLGFALPLGDFAIGAAFHVPYARSANGEPDGPQRFYGVTSSLRLLEQDLALSVRPIEPLTLGAALRVGEFSFSSDKAIDTGAMLNASLDPDPALPVGDPLLEGSQRLESIDDVIASFVVGAAVDVGRVHLVTSFRPPWATRGRGQVTFVPSTDFTAQIGGDVQVELVMPAQLDLAARLDLGPVVLHPELQWVGWGRTGRNTADVTSLELSVSDPLLDGVLSSAGLDQADFVTSQQGSTEADMHWHDVVNVGLSVSGQVNRALELRAGAWYSPAAVEDEYVHTGNLDFAVVDARLAAAVRFTDAVGVIGSFDAMPGFARTITDSKYTQVDPEAPPLALPVSNGVYDVDLWRAGLTVWVRFPSNRGEPT